jgi:hypothetical protein
MLKSGVAAADRYIAEHYLSVRGMSSRFAATISAAVMRIQSEHGISGNLAEIGTFEGRYFIALAHALKDGERAIGIDTFTWPDEGIKDRLEANLAKYGPASPAIVVKGSSLELSADKIRALAPEKKIRFFHIDGEHTPKHLSNDMALAAQTLDPDGVICLDDMLHPGYPTLGVIVDRFLKENPDFRVCCVIDREDIVAAPKFMLCRKVRFEFYVAQLLQTFPNQVWPMGADFGAYLAVVLTPEPKLADIG